MQNAAIVSTPVVTAAVVEPVHAASGGRGLVFFLLTLTGVGVLSMMMRTERVA